MDAEGLDVLVRGVGMTVGCMEMLSRDPCAEVLSLLALLVQTVLRLLALLVQRYDGGVHGDGESRSV